MSQTITLESGPTSSTTSRGSGSMFRTLSAAAVFLVACGLVATTLLDGSADATAAPPPASALPATPFITPTGDTSVPDASTVFAGRDVGIEEPAPTF